MHALTVVAVLAAIAIMVAEYRRISGGRAAPESSAPDDMAGGLLGVRLDPVEEGTLAETADVADMAVG